jgi:hypothetical protein
MSRIRSLRLTAVLGITVATIAASGAVEPVSAASPKRPAFAIVASGLDNPRQLSFDKRGHLYVAEAGRGGSGPCFMGGDGTLACYGTSGAVSRIGRRGHHRVLSGLPSLAAKNGSSAIGPSDLVLGRGGRFKLSIGLGNNPKVRATLPYTGRHFLGTIISARAGHVGRRVFADLAGYEAAKDPDHQGPDSDPVGFIRRGRGLVAVDAGGNDIVGVTRHGRISALRGFPNKSVKSPFGPGNIPMQAVPTSVIRGPGKSLFVSQLTGFPFPKGAASIFRVVPGRRTQVYATGLTNVTDIAWHNGHLYAVQISNKGLFAETGLPQGSLVRVPAGSTKPITVANLPAPYGVAIRRGSAYVTTCSVCAGGGGIARIPVS